MVLPAEVPYVASVSFGAGRRREVCSALTQDPSHKYPLDSKLSGEQAGSQVTVRVVGVGEAGHVRKDFR